MLAHRGGVPAGLGIALGTWYVGCGVAGGCGEPSNPVGSAGFDSVLVAVPVLQFMLAVRADRGELLMALNETIAHNPLARPGPNPGIDARPAQSGERLDLSAAEDPCFGQRPLW